MRKAIWMFALGIAAAAIMTGCYEAEDESPETPTPQTRAEGDPAEDDIDLSKIYFDEESGMWLMPLDEEEEPNQLQNGIMPASGIAPQMVITNPNDPPPGPIGPIGIIPGQVNVYNMVTGHYLKIWPKSDEEIETLMDMGGGVIVSYHPFDAVPVPTVVMERLRLFNPPLLAVNAKYTVSEEVAYSPDPAEIGTVLLRGMPVLYAIWPITTPYPDWMDYEILGERVEQIEIADPSYTPPGIPSAPSIIYKPQLRFVVWDSTLNRYMALANVRVLVQSGKQHVEKGTTNETGIFKCDFKVNSPATISVSVIWDHPQFWLLNNGTQAEYNLNFKMDKEKCFTDYFTIELPESMNSTVFRAAHYWFEYEDVHGLRTSCATSGKVKIYSNDYENPEDKDGKFMAYTYWDWDKMRLRYTSWIKVWRNHNEWHHVFCTTLHEMGHGSMYAYKDSNFHYDYATTGDRISDGWANFTGWYLTNLAYEGWGYTGGWNLGKTRQEWNRINAGQYSPMFIDLYDSENQRSVEFANKNPNYLNYPDDRISGVPPKVIEHIAFHSKVYGHYVGHLNKYVGVYYTRKEMDDYLSIYNAIW